MNVLATPTSAAGGTVPALTKIDGNKIADTIQQALLSAGLDIRSGPLKGVTDTIQQALSSAGMLDRCPPFEAADTTIDVEARVIAPSEQVDTAAKNGRDAPASAQPGQFVSRSYSNAAGTRAYKLYVPKSYAGEPVPLIVMLHGCTQNPDDFANGTRMNELAERHGFLVVYPAQSANANGSNCWNWFKAQDQARDRGEPALIAGITCEVVSTYRVDEQRIFVAGLSAGAAMAVILGETHPDLYAGVGAHSGLPYGAAHDMPSAFSAMQGTQPLRGTPNWVGGSAKTGARVTHAVPTIVFHGDCDATVNSSNGSEIVKQAASQATSAGQNKTLEKQVRQSTSKGRDYTTTVYAEPSGRPLIEQWVLHGAGHAWSGGSPKGSYTEASGPDASAEMVRFFLAQRGAPNALTSVQ
jgi:poly(hydroxyalkanoate) depolymerase family esterase